MPEGGSCEVLRQLPEVGARPGEDGGVRLDDNGLIHGFLLGITGRGPAAAVRHTSRTAYSRAPHPRNIEMPRPGCRASVMPC